MRQCASIAEVAIWWAMTGSNRRHSRCKRVQGPSEEAKTAETLGVRWTLKDTERHPSPTESPTGGPTLPRGSVTARIYRVMLDGPPMVVGQNSYDNLGVRRLVPHVPSGTSTVRDINAGTQRRL